MAALDRRDGAAIDATAGLAVEELGTLDALMNNAEGMAV